MKAVNLLHNRARGSMWYLMSLELFSLGYRSGDISQAIYSSSNCLSAGTILILVEFLAYLKTQLFSGCLLDCGLQDIRFSGQPFTWQRCGIRRLPDSLAFAGGF
ncbi:hypothetical protein Ahy_A06g030046 isoform C [Arachis hypogaea]|uniref:Uncharacterized protein n=1 Tax=Arachis hypogaea TaxID=3818 RepID=A0A445CV21_ARAHY|nr:hypothetical protein Ahy_A06g030046 isoform C [Arachis hypogaea]